MDSKVTVGKTVKTVFISACEPSADSHCANLIRSIRKKSYDPKSGNNFEVEFVGIGGAEMQAAGCEIIENPVSRASMLYNAFRQIFYFIGLIRRVRRLFREKHFDLVVVCDSPAFNFHVASAAKKNGSAVMFYVAPQLWAWASWRIAKMRKYCDRLACILPFERDWFARRGIDAVFVGNPLFDDLGFQVSSSYKDYKKFEARNARIALMPGSRDAEIARLWPAMQQIAMRLKNRWPGMSFKAVALDEQKMEMLRNKQIPEFQVSYVIEPVAKAAQESDLAIVASGSATLQVAAAGCPMIIMYQSSKLLWNLLGQFLVKSRFLSLVNILAGRELVNEFMPYFDSIDPIVERCFRLLGNRTKLINTSHDLVSLVEPMARANASDKTADIAVDMLGC